MQSYVVVFLTTGALAVAFKFLGEQSESRLAGLIAMMPLKIMLAWAILGSAGGTAALRESIPGMAIGLVALVVLLATGWFISARAGVTATIVIGSAVWLGTALVVHQAVAETSQQAAPGD